MSVAALARDEPGLPSVLSLDDAEWLAFVDANRAEAGPFHHPAWARTLGAAYSLEVEVRAIRRGGRIDGGIPVIRAPRGDRRVSLPFTDYCPPLGPTSHQVAAAFLAEAAAAGTVAEVRAPVDGLEGSPAGYRHVLTLERDEDAVLRRLPKDTRWTIRKLGREPGLVVRRAETVDDLVGVFYTLHLRTRRRLGVPVQPRRFFRALWEQMFEAGLGWALIAEHEGTPVAGAVFLAYGGTAVYKFSAADPAWRGPRPTSLLLWEAIREACARGCRELDLGRSDPWSTGLRKFKSDWGDEQQLFYTRTPLEPHGEKAAGPGRSSRVLGSVLRRSPTVLTRIVGELLYRYTA